MHEASIVYSLIEQVRAFTPPRAAVLAVRVEVGVLEHLDGDVLQNLWSMFAEDAALRGAVLEVRPRGGGERFKPHPTRPSKTLKRLFQDAGIPEFERGRLPLLWRRGELIYVAGLGADVRMTDRDGERIVVEWQPDAGLIDRNP